MMFKVKDKNLIRPSTTRELITSLFHSLEKFNSDKEIRQDRLQKWLPDINDAIKRTKMLVVGSIAQSLFLHERSLLF